VFQVNPVQALPDKSGVDCWYSEDSVLFDTFAERSEKVLYQLIGKVIDLAKNDER
jgi:hypothetical protein